MALPDYVPSSNPFAAGDDFPSTAAGVTLPGGVTAVICDYPHKASVGFTNLIVESWNGSEKRSAKGDGRIRFSLRFEQLTPTDGNTIWNHYLAQHGTLNSFSYFDYLSGEEITVRYATEVLDRETFLFEAEKAGIDLIQVL